MFVASQETWGYDTYKDAIAANGGLLYIQNAAANGPASWLFHEIVARPMRWDKQEDKPSFGGMLPRDTCIHMDQVGY